MIEGLAKLAAAAGVAPRWLDVHSAWHDVGHDTMLAVLDSLGLPGHTPAQQAESHAILAHRRATLPALVTATANEPIWLPITGCYRLSLEDGMALEGTVGDGGMLPGVAAPGYHRLDAGGQQTILAVAPARGYTVQDAAPGIRPWALAVQLYALRRDGDGGIGDFRALTDLVAPAARLGAAGIAISPVHAQFSADPYRFSPYSPSSRVMMNVLSAGIDVPDAGHLEALDLIDWPAATRLRLAALRTAFDDAAPRTRAEFERFRTDQGSALDTHATFEALHAHQFGADPAHWHWRTWPADLQQPESPAVAAFAREHAGEVAFHAFLQFLADQSASAAHQAARDAGMSIGLIADLAVGADSGGSHCWSRQDETLLGMTVGAPPDLLSARGQSWGLAAFSPRGLLDSGYRAYIEMLRATMRHAGGVRIDHALGLARLWVVPDGMAASEGAYLSFPLDDMLRLIALESHRNRCIVLGEDLGTIPDGFQERLAVAGALGMRVLWFEKRHGLFLDPRHWSNAAAAMTSTHDLATVAGWWTSRDLAWRGRLGLSGGPERHAIEEVERVTDRTALWAAMQHSGAATGPAPAPDDPAPVLDAATRHLATAACDLLVLPIEDALGLEEQPNLPGTMNEQHPNWRRRLPGKAAQLLDAPAVAARLASLSQGRPAT